MKQLTTKNLIAFLSLAVLCNLVLCSLAPAQETKPDTVLLNGKFFTGVASQPYVQAVAIRGERIMATGDTKTIQALAGPNTVAIDLHGSTAIPGINDAHHHFSLGPAEVDVDFQTLDPSWEQVKNGIVAAIAKNPPNSLIAVTIGFQVFGDTSVDRDALDKIAPNNPVTLGTFTGHAMILNSAALRFYNVSETQPDPLGGRLERDAKGRLTGTIREYALMNMSRAAADRIPDSEAIVQLRQQLEDEAKYGVTSIQELSVAMPPARAVSLLKAVPTQIRVRIVRMPGTTPAGRDVAEGKRMPAHPASLITVSGSKWLADGVGVEGTLTPRGAWKLPAKPPFDSLMADLPLQFPEAEYRTMLQETIDNNDQLLLHISGNRSAQTVLDAIDATGGKSIWDGRRLCFEHGDGIFPDQFARIKQDGIIVVQNPIHLAPIVPPGVVAFEKAQPLKSLLEAGIPLAFGSDAPVNPYLDIMFATNPGNRPSEAITREQAVIAYTRTSAYAEFAEKEKGTLEPGKFADIAVLSQDIFTVPAPDLPKTLSVLTMVGGKVVYKAPDPK
ncbi:amidohydrolase [Terracidiphilus gabretensis]|uniref:amidohydrolase n=1 Tax=Terracidiphilus gabretensis TaxID=1577687 RepID=UPI00071B8A98|nr:amidohydrolase [Terracidiphilus gabretensis]